MARVRSILIALGRAFGRDQKSIVSLAGNNLFIVSVLLLREAGAFVYLLFGLILLFPLSTDPLRKIPASRLAIWPLGHREHVALRFLSPWVNPLSWLLAALALWFTPGLWFAFAALVAAAFLFSDLPFRGQAGWLRFPRNQLVRKNLRQMLATLDFYCALLLAIAGTIARIAMHLPAEAMLAMTMLVTLALSSYAQSLFGLDGEGRIRYRLLPRHGREILAAKDAAFLLLSIPLTLPLAPLAGTAASLIALAMGHHASLRHPREQQRWRFSTGASVLFGLEQALAMTVAAGGVFFKTPLLLIPCVLIWLGSLVYYGREVNRSTD